MSATQPASITAVEPGGSGGPLTPTGTPTGVDSTGSSEGTISSFTGSAAPGSEIVNGRATDLNVIVGTFTFTTEATLSIDGPDAFIRFFDPGDHADFDSGAAHTHITFGDLSVNTAATSHSMNMWGLTILGIVTRVARESRHGVRPH
ncbi:MAG: hypothetical protein GY910_23860 [bacterium]|nr:hypothetical protein [bacterium]